MTVRIAKPPVNIREKLAELERPIGLNGSALMRTETPQEAFSLIGAGRKNLIINGNFKISQRGDYTTSPVTAGHDSYWLDRWISLKDGTTSTVRRITTTVNGISQYAARIECTSAGSGIMGFGQRVELSSIPVGKTLTFSAWVRTNQPYVGFRTNSFQGSGGDRGVKVNPNGSWQRIYWTFDSTGTTIGGPDILIVAYNNTPVSIAVGNYIEIAEVQLEEGKVATPFEYRSIGEELALCQRYYYRLSGGSMRIASGYNESANNGTYFIQFPVTMRTAVTAVEQSGTASDYGIYRLGATVNCTSVPTYEGDGGRNYGCAVRFYQTSGLTTGQGSIATINNTLGFLGFNAEL